ncbi:Riboflavin transporter MCH5 [Grifola frondosa]|uniref:Riboflavin transporter MCH5 n=1 Tax=Grifola frondosa TaxID=5627 RepID=A0A1C7LPS9_GRIFR|nr:Riboflavin transporter MCH5 [Grifola frondosa]
MDTEKEKGGIVNVQSLESTPLPIYAKEKVDIPDGGFQAWTVVLGASLALFSSAGMVNAYGVFQNYYETTLLPSSSSSTIALIGAIQIFLLYGLGPIVGRIFDAYGSDVLLRPGSFIAVFSMMMISLAQKDQPYQLFLSQGVLFGIGIAMIFNPALAVLGHWFRYKRAYAIGLVTGGSATGGVCFPIIIERLIPIVGFGWAVRIVAFLIMVCLIVSCITIRTRLPLSGHVSLRTAVDFDGFRDPQYVLAGIGAFLLFYAFFIPYFYIQIYADFQGVPSRISDYILPIMNALNLPSRILPGLLADRFGTLNVFVPAAVVCSALIFGLWLPSRNTAAIVAFSALYGLFSGAFVSLLPTHIATISPREKYGARLGSIYMLVAVATLAGTPTAGALLKVSDRSHFNGLIVFTGVLTVAGALTLAAAGALSRKEVQKSHKESRESSCGSDPS